MLAPSRRQVADLNQRARAHRLAGHQPTLEIDLADGNRASVGDLIITRRNDRRLTAGRDWVRNGDRWTITAITPDGGIRATHRRTGKSVTLPGRYVREAVELGYATTIHTAQGVTADTTHGLVDELMTREQLYTMVTRGRTANHLYLPVGGDGDPHGIPQATPVNSPPPKCWSGSCSAAASPPPRPPSAGRNRPRPPCDAASTPLVPPTSRATDLRRSPVGRPHPGGSPQLLIRVFGGRRAANREDSASPPVDCLVSGPAVKGGFAVLRIRFAHP